MEKQIYMKQLSPEKAKLIEERRKSRRTERGFKYLRRDSERDNGSAVRPPFVRDAEKIINSPYYNRLSNKTQVLSFYRNDDISRRALHVQLVSRIARTIGAALDLDADLIEAIAVGHDLGHTPFGHAGEDILSRLLHDEEGVYFNHNVQSARILDVLSPQNLTLETLDGILCHNGEMPSDFYRPRGIKDFNDFDSRMENCSKDKNYIKTLVPATLEGCLVRLCDMIAYLGKDRQDYEKARLGDISEFPANPLGNRNATIINNLSVNIIENSLGKDYIMLDKEHFDALKSVKEANYKVIYKTEKVVRHYGMTIEPMMERVFKKLLNDYKNKDSQSVIYKHHIDFIKQNRSYLDEGAAYIKETPPAIITADFISGMTDGYFLQLYDFLFGVPFHGYFEDLPRE